MHVTVDKYVNWYCCHHLNTPVYILDLGTKLLTTKADDSAEQQQRELEEASGSRRTEGN